MMSARRSGMCAISSVLAFWLAGCNASPDDPDNMSLAMTAALIISLVVIFVPRRKRRPDDTSELGRLPSKINDWNRFTAAWRKDPGNQRRNT